MSNVVPFNFGDVAVRVVMQGGEPWWVASDVAQALEYRDSFNMVRHLDDEEKGTRIVSTLGGDQQVQVINESGLYSAILKSRKQSAKRFKKWVTGEVLPTIRKTGSFGTAPQFAVPTSFAAALRLAGELEEQRAVLTHQVETQSLKIAEDAPKVGVYHQIADSTGLIGFQKFCTDLKLNQREVKHWLKDIGWLRANQYAVNPLPTAAAVDAGYCDTTYFTTTSGRIVQTLWFTGKAVTYVAEKAPDYIRKRVRKSRVKKAA